MENDAKLLEDDEELQGLELQQLGDRNNLFKSHPQKVMLNPFLRPLDLPKSSNKNLL